MKLIVLTNLFPTPADPNRGIFNFQQIQRLDADINTVVLVPIDWRHWKDSYRHIHEWRGVRVLYFPFYFLPGIAHRLHGVCMANSIRLLGARLLNSLKPDCVIGSWLYPDGLGARWLAARFGVPLILKAHGSDVNIKANNARLQPSIAKAVKSAEALIVVSEALAVAAVNARLTAKRIVVVYNGVNLAQFRIKPKAECRQYFGLPPAGRLVVFIGNLKVSKGALDAASAMASLMARLDGLHLAYAGVGPAKFAIERLFRERGLSGQLHMLGRVEHERIADLLNAADALVLPSHAEGVPNVVLEAQACGTPVVANAVGGIPEVLSEAQGALVPSRDIAALRTALETVLGRTYDREEIRKNVLHLSWDRSAALISLQVRIAAGNGPCAVTR